jgi:hypothetical protein
MIPIQESLKALLAPDFSEELPMDAKRGRFYFFINFREKKKQGVKNRTVPFFLTIEDILLKLN